MITRLLTPLALAAMLALPVTPATAQDQSTEPDSAAPEATPPESTESAPVGHDPTVVDFVLPGHFADALEAAKERNRCLMIKGVAFGVDAEGATCATKGHW